ncbi:hypothetical protein ACEWY4_007101 [Coilia grayii]|uniref:BESS domain-containing protein n=1 Tax=Coilia grayii TaxID=363190 RepID=A0ABD1KFL6_9TELE
MALESRLTASRFHKVLHARSEESMERLAIRILKGTRQTAAMRRGLELEPELLRSYGEVAQVNIYACDFVVHPDAPHLGASPDGRVVDPTEIPPFGLVELLRPRDDGVLCEVQGTITEALTKGGVMQRPPSLFRPYPPTSTNPKQVVSIHHSQQDDREDPNICKNKGKSLRDTFNRLRKNKAASGSAPGKNRWRHFGALSFLLPHLKQRRSSSNLNHEEENEDGEEEEVEEVDVESGEDVDVDVEDDGEKTEDDGVERAIEREARGTSREEVKSGKHTYSSKRRRAEAPKKPSTEDLYAILQQPVTPDDPDEMFLLSLLPDLKKIVHNKGQLKLQLMSTILNWENQNFHPSTLPPTQPYQGIPPMHTTQSTPYNYTYYNSKSYSEL